MAMHCDLQFLIGDSWASPVWAVIVGGQGVDLTQGWTVHAQVRRRASDEAVLHEWAGSNIVLGQAQVTRTGGQLVFTSTVRLSHSGVESRAIPPFHGVWDLEIRKGSQTYTIVGGTARAIEDVTR